MLKISTARSTTQTSDESRLESSQIGQGDFSVNAPQVVQNWIFSRATKMTSASCLTTAESVCTKCKAIRSAERGPTPGNLFSAAMSVVMDSGRTDIPKFIRDRANSN